MTDSPTQENICCPEFNVENWDKKHFEWKNKRFVRDKVFTFFHIPVGFGRTMTKIMKKMTASGVNSPEWMSLSHHTSRWNMDVLVEVDGEVKGADNTVLNGKFYSRVYEGPYKDTQKWCDDYELDIADQDKELKKMYMWYVYCPKCAKKYGKNYTAIIGEITN